MADASSIFRNKFKKYISSLKDTSYDSINDKYLCQNSTQEVYNFDLIVKDRNPLKQPSSFDSLLIYDYDVYCIEFKNQKHSDIDGTQIKNKLIYGKNNIQKRDYKFIYCVVYKNCTPHYNRFKCGILKGMPRFNLEECKEKGVVKDIFTEDVNFFIKAFKKKILKELKC
ncbi:hypothetical protein QUF74_11245 [Candidatus Halobeggiatoa sp. HSG11]|nr:hypothetical protein [Candidatus Halobeggiatoa sp. HSG11]